jgi:hypothetical protein
VCKIKSKYNLKISRFLYQLEFPFLLEFASSLEFKSLEFPFLLEFGISFLEFTSVLELSMILEFGISFLEFTSVLEYGT